MPDNNPFKSIDLYHYKKIYEIESYYRNEQNRRYSQIESLLRQNIREILSNENEINNKRYAKKVIKNCVSVSFGFVPILSNAKGIVEAIMGKDLITDEELNILERVYAGVSALPVIGDLISWENWVMKILKKLFAI